MNRTLADKINLKSLDDARRDEPKGVRERLLRLVDNVCDSLGLFSSQGKTIHARIYLAYVLGYCTGFYRWRQKRACDK